jgi:hypothetical protein
LQLSPTTGINEFFVPLRPVTLSACDTLKTRRLPALQDRVLQQPGKAGRERRFELEGSGSVSLRQVQRQTEAEYRSVVEQLRQDPGGPATEGDGSSPGSGLGVAPGGSKSGLPGSAGSAKRAGRGADCSGGGADARGDTAFDGRNSGGSAAKGRIRRWGDGEAVCAAEREKDAETGNEAISSGDGAGVSQSDEGGGKNEAVEVVGVERIS